MLAASRSHDALLASYARSSETLPKIGNVSLEPLPFYMYTEAELLGEARLEEFSACKRRQVARYGISDYTARRRSLAPPPVDLRYKSWTGVLPEHSASKYFLQIMESHPWRTWNASAAKAFIVPLDLEPFFPSISGGCSMDFIDSTLLIGLKNLQKSFTFQNFNGTDHLWMLAQNSPEMTLWMARRTWKFVKESGVLRNMIAGVIEVFAFRSAKPVLRSDDFTSYMLVREPRAVAEILWRPSWGRPWRCSLPVPYVQSFAYLWTPPDLLTFEGWLNRKYMFFHHAGLGTQGSLSAKLRAQVFKIHDLAADPERVLIGSSYVHSDYLVKGFRKSRFCFCIAGRNGGATRKFYDSIAHGCLPVVIVDTWLFTAAPFDALIDHGAYAIFVSQTRWMNDLPAVVLELETMSLSNLQERVTYMRHVAHLLLYDIGTGAALGAALLWQASLRCSFYDRRINDSLLHPIGTPLKRSPEVLRW